VVELAHLVRIEARQRLVPPRRLHDRSRRQLRDRDVVGVAVHALGAERQHHIGAVQPHHGGDAGDRRHGRGPIQLAVPIAEEGEMADAQDLGGLLQFARAPGRHRLRTGVRSELPALLTPRRHHQARLDTLRRVPSQRRTETHRFVVGVRQHRHHPQGPAHRRPPAVGAKGSCSRKPPWLA
jgi:hypothetical protein